MAVRVLSKIIFKVLVFTATSVPALMWANSSIAAEPKSQNLLSLSTSKFEAPLSHGLAASAERLLRDGDVASKVPVNTLAAKPVQLLYSFGGKTVTLKKLRISTKGIKKDVAKIEVLVSTVSAKEGYSSLRVEPLNASKGWQSFEFEQGAAKWIMIKVIPFKGQASFTIAELELIGHEGPPVTVYKFKESPASALQVLAKLSASVNLKISPEERSLFADAADGKLDTWSFAEASLLSSGVTDKRQRARYLKQIDALHAAASKSIPTNIDTFARGRALLTWLHKRAFKKGYKEKQTDVSTVLDTATFNCVSSATLYNILARRMGLDVRGIEVPDHAFSILYDGTRHADIETTTKAGFNPARNRAGLTEFQRQTGFVYIADRNRSKRREIGDTGLVALTYYNHGVGFAKKKLYEKALVSNFKALSLDPKNKSAVKNVLAALGNWSSSLSKSGDYDKALAVLNTGLALAPKDWTLRHNKKVVWQQKFRKSLDQGDVTIALAHLKTAYQETRDSSFLNMQSWVFSRQGEGKIKARDWDGALALADAGLRVVDPSARRRLERWRVNVVRRWSKSAIDAKKFALAMDVVEQGLKRTPKNYTLQRDLGYIAQEWTGNVAALEGDKSAQLLAVKLRKRFPKSSSVHNAARNVFNFPAGKAIKSGNFERGIAIYNAGLIALPKDYQLTRNLRATWSQWASGAIKKRNWKAALEILGRAYATDQSASLYQRNIAYVTQEWSREVAKKDGAPAGEKLVASIAQRFPKIYQVQKARGQLIQREVIAAIRASKYEEAEKKLLAGKAYFPDASRFGNLVVNIYYRWARPLSAKGQWEQAIAIYQRGYKTHPANGKLKRNLVATWHGWANVHMKKKQWQQAIDIYKQGLIALPGTSLFKRNIAYCEQEMKR